MSRLVKSVLPLCLIAGLAGCYGGGGYGYSDTGYYGDYAYAPSYGVGFAYYGGDNYHYRYHNWAPHNDWHYQGSGNHWRWHPANSGRYGGGRH